MSKAFEFNKPCVTETQSQKHTSAFALDLGVGWNLCSLEAPKQNKNSHQTKPGQIQFQTQKVVVTSTALILTRRSPWGAGDDSHSPFTAVAFAFLWSRRRLLLVWSTQILHWAFGGHAVELAHHQLVQVVGVRQPCHQQTQPWGKPTH